MKDEEKGSVNENVGYSSWRENDQKKKGGRTIIQPVLTDGQKGERSY